MAGTYEHVTNTLELSTNLQIESKDANLSLHTTQFDYYYGELNTYDLTEYITNTGGAYNPSIITASYGTPGRANYIEFAMNNGILTVDAVGKVNGSLLVQKIDVHLTSDVSKIVGVNLIPLPNRNMVNHGTITIEESQQITIQPSDIMSPDLISLESSNLRIGGDKFTARLPYGLQIDSDTGVITGMIDINSVGAFYGEYRVDTTIGNIVAPIHLIGNLAPPSLIINNNTIRLSELNTGNITLEEFNVGGSGDYYGANTGLGENNISLLEYTGYFKNIPNDIKATNIDLVINNRNILIHHPGDSVHKSTLPIGTIIEDGSSGNVLCLPTEYGSYGNILALPSNGNTVGTTFSTEINTYTTTISLEVYTVPLDLAKTTAYTQSGNITLLTPGPNQVNINDFIINTGGKIGSYEIVAGKGNVTADGNILNSTVDIGVNSGILTIVPDSNYEPDKVNTITFNLKNRPDIDNSTDEIEISLDFIATSRLYLPCNDTLVLQIDRPIEVACLQATSATLKGSNPYSIDVGLPPGLTFNTETSIISGTPTTLGTTVVTFSAEVITDVGTISAIITLRVVKYVPNVEFTNNTIEIQQKNTVPESLRLLNVGGVIEDFELVKGAQVEDTGVNITNAAITSFVPYNSWTNVVGSSSPSWYYWPSKRVAINKNGTMMVSMNPKENKLETYMKNQGKWEYLVTSSIAYNSSGDYGYYVDISGNDPGNIENPPKLVLVSDKENTFKVYTWSTVGSWIQYGGDTSISAQYIETCVITDDATQILIGSPNNSYKRQVDLFVDNGTQFVQTTAFTNTDLSNNLHGASLALNNTSDGNLIVTSSPTYSNSVGISSVHEWTSASTKVEIIRYTANDSKCGWSVAMSKSSTKKGTRLIIGVPGTAAEGGGHAIVMERLSGPSWMMVGNQVAMTKTATDLNDFDRTGYSVSITDDGNMIAVGCPGYNGAGLRRGRVRLYEYKSITLDWVEHAVEIVGKSDGEELGHNIELSGNGDYIVVATKTRTYLHKITGIQELPNGLAINTVSGTIIGKARVPGKYPIVMKLSNTLNNTKQTQLVSFRLDITESAPELSAKHPQLSLETSGLEQIKLARDYLENAGGTITNYSIIGKNIEATINNTTGTLTSTLDTDIDKTNEYFIHIQGTNGNVEEQGVSSANLTIIPTIAFDLVKNHSLYTKEGDPTHFKLSEYSTIDVSTISNFTADNLPTGLSIHAESGNISGVPSNDSIGLHYISIFAHNKDQAGNTVGEIQLCVDVDVPNIEIPESNSGNLLGNVINFTRNTIAQVLSSEYANSLGGFIQNWSISCEQNIGNLVALNTPIPPSLYALQSGGGHKYSAGDTSIAGREKLASDGGNITATGEFTFWSDYRFPLGTSSYFSLTEKDARRGPTLADAKRYYGTLDNNAWWMNPEYFSVINESEDTTDWKKGGGIQIWTVPQDGVYTIEAQGASGGGYTTGWGGHGARIWADFELNMGDKISILVGQAGQSSSYFSAADGGGGGASYVVKHKVVRTNYDRGDILIIAGGGGGTSGSIIDGMSANTFWGHSSVTPSQMNDGIVTTNNLTPSGASNTNNESDGGGFLSGEGGSIWNTVNGTTTGYSGKSFVDGGYGGNKEYHISGGFGGGGGAHGSNYNGGGGGGGYIGGAGSKSDRYGYAGTSFVQKVLAISHTDSSGTDPLEVARVDLSFNNSQQYSEVVATSDNRALQYNNGRVIVKFKGPTPVHVDLAKYTTELPDGLSIDNKTGAISGRAE